MILRILSNDISLKNWISNISFGFELSHERGVIEIENVVSNLDNSIDIGTALTRHFVIVFIGNFDFGFDFHFRSINDGFVFEH